MLAKGGWDLTRRLKGKLTRLALELMQFSNQYYVVQNEQYRYKRNIEAHSRNHF
jgi:hypothetical protein